MGSFVDIDEVFESTDGAFRAKESASFGSANGEGSPFVVIVNCEAKRKPRFRDRGTGDRLQDGSLALARIRGSLSRP